jgi:hypothetical protein
MKKLVGCIAFVLLMPSIAAAQADDSSKQVVIVQGEVAVPPPPTVVVGVEAPPPAVIVTPVPAQPQPVYVQPQPVYVQPQPVYVQPQPVYVPPQPVYVEPEPVEEDKTFTIEVNPLWFWFGNVQAKLAVADWVGLAGQFDFMYINFLGWKMWMTGVTVGVDFFFTGRAPEGPFLGPRVGYEHFNWSDEWSDSEWAVEVVRAGVSGGYQWIWDSGFSLLVGGTLTYIADVAKSDSTFDNWLLGIPMLSFDIAFGFGV